MAGLEPARPVDTSTSSWPVYQFQHIRICPLLGHSDIVQMENDPKMASKPEKVKEGIVTGKLRKFYEENCLLQQAFVKDSSMSVEQYIASVAKAAGGTITFKNAVRFEKGEGIEKRQ